MEISPVTLAIMLLRSFEIGAASGIFYDIQRVIRAFFGIGAIEKELVWKLPIIKKELTLTNGKKSGKISRNIILFFGDFLTVAFAGIGLIILNYSYNNGHFRWMTVLGTFLGFLLYFFTVGKLTGRILSLVAFALKYGILSFFAILGYPFQAFLKVAIKFVVKICFLFKIILANRQKRVYNINEKICFLDLAKNGFIEKEVLEKIKK